MKTILLSIILLAIALLGIAIKLVIKKNGRFSGTCSSNNPLLQNKNGNCTICGAKQVEQCKS